MKITKFQRYLSEGDIMDGDIGGSAQQIGRELMEQTWFVTISDLDHDMFYYDKKGKIWRENASDIIWRFVAKNYRPSQNPC